MVNNNRNDEKEEAVDRRKDRLKHFRTNKIATVLHKQNIINCGYCSKPVKLFSSKAVSSSAKRENVNLFYLCQKKCARSMPQRSGFLDEAILRFIWKRVNELPPPESDSANFDQAINMAKELREFQQKRQDKLQELPSAGYNVDKIMQEVKELEDKIDEIERDLEEFKELTPQENPLLRPLWYISLEEFLEREFEWHRALISLLVRNIRFFNEYLVLRVLPLTEEEDEYDQGFGKRAHVSLREFRYDEEKVKDSQEGESEGDHQEE